MCSTPLGWMPDKMRSIRCSMLGIWMLATAHSGTVRDFSTSLEMTRSAARRSVECRIKCASDFGIQITDKMTGTNALHQLIRRSLDFDSGTAGQVEVRIPWFSARPGFPGLLDRAAGLLPVILSLGRCPL